MERLTDKIRDNLYRLNPGYWWEVVDSRTHLHARFHAIRAALNWRLEERTIQSMYNVFYFQYAIDQAKQDGREDAADFIESAMRYVTPGTAVSDLRHSVARVRAYNESSWKNQTAHYFPASMRKKG